MNLSATRHPFCRLLGLAMLGLSALSAEAQSTTIGWNFTDLDATFDTGTPANFSVGTMAIANSFGTVATPINGTSASSGYTGATGGGNIGNAVNNAAFSTASSPYTTVTFTPAAGYSLQIAALNFGMRSTATGATAYALYSSVDNYAAPILTGTNAANSAWTLKSNATFSLNGVLNTPVTLRLYTYGGASNAGSGTINTRIDDIAITLSATAGVVASEVRVETASDGTGSVVAAQPLSVGSSLTAFSISRDSTHAFIANAAASWSLTSVTGGVVAGDLVAAGDGKSAIFTPHAGGSAVIHAAISGLVSVDSGVITASATPTNPSASASADSTNVVNGGNVVLTVAVTPGTNPGSTGLTVTGDLSAIGGSATQQFAAGSGNSFTFTAAIPAALPGGSAMLNFTVQDAQGRSGTASLGLSVRGSLAIFHTNDTHARVTPHYWIVPQHSGNTQLQFEAVGGAAYTGGKMLSLVGGQPDALVLDGGDISEGNPVGDWNGPGGPTGTFGNGTSVEYYKLLDTKLRAVAGRGGRGIDAMVVGNHDIRDISYLNNMKNQTNFPVISINICNKGTLTAYFQPYVVLNVNGNKIGVIGYTTETSDSPESAVNTLIDVVKCDWSGTGTTKIHLANIVNDLRNNQGCNLVILLTHDGHSDLCTSSSGSTPILVDNSAGKLPEIAVTGHWHTWAETVWQPSVLNYKTIFTEAGSFEHYVGELRVDGNGKYLSNANYPLRNSDITPDPDIASLIQTRIDQYAAASPAYGLDQVIGYTADDLLLDNYMKWWSADEYPWSGNNTAGNWICDGMQWKAIQLFGPCDLCVESGGGVRSDIPAGPVTYTKLYETYPWADDTIYMVNMTGQEIWNYVKLHGCDVGLSQGWFVTAFDGIPTAISYNGNPIDLAHTYQVAISNYMYLHDSVPFSDPSPRTSTYLARTALIDFTSQFTQASPYHAGSSRYSLNTEFSGGYRAVVLMMNDADSSTVFEDGFIRMLSATPETLQHRGTPQVPASLVNADGSFNPTNRLAENELYRSYLGFKTGALHPGDIIETWGKGSFYQGDPEFVDQEGIYANGVEFKVVGHDDSLAKPTYMPSIGSFWNDTFKNHYVRFLARKTGSNTVADQSGQTIPIMDVTAFAAMALPGSTGDLLMITGIPTMENYALRFRGNSAVPASSLGISNFPAASAVSSHVDAVAADTTGASIGLTATTTVNSNNTFQLLPVADAQVSSGNPASNFGTTTNLFIQSSTTAASSFGNERSWLKFDLSSLPAGATIASAGLQMYCWKATGASLPAEVRGESDDSWTETGLTWNNQPSLDPVLSTQTLASGGTGIWYNWDVTAFAQAKLAGDKLVSLVAKPVTEDSPAAQTFGFDSREFGGTSAYLQVTTQASGPSVTVAQVEYFYRFSTDSVSWGAWSSAGVSTSAPYPLSFAFPQGYGYYEFYSVATDSLGGVEGTPAAAEAATHYSATPPYSTVAVVTLGGLSATYDGSAKPATATTVPPGLAMTVTYDGSTTAPTQAGSYAVAATVNQAGYSGSAAGTLTIAKAGQVISFGSLAPTTVGAQPILLGATSSSGLAVTYATSDPSIATVSGNQVTPVGVGTAIITASQAGNNNYTHAADTQQSLSVGQQTGSNPDDNGAPAMPIWALAVLAALLAAVAVPFLGKRRSHGIK